MNRNSMVILIGIAVVMGAILSTSHVAYADSEHIRITSWTYDGSVLTVNTNKEITLYDQNKIWVGEAGSNWGWVLKNAELSARTDTSLTFDVRFIRTEISELLQPEISFGTGMVTHHLEDSDRVRNALKTGTTLNEPPTIIAAYSDGIFLLKFDKPVTSFDAFGITIQDAVSTSTRTSMYGEDAELSSDGTSLTFTLDQYSTNMVGSMVDPKLHLRSGAIAFDDGPIGPISSISITTDQTITTPAIDPSLTSDADQMDTTANMNVNTQQCSDLYERLDELQSRVDSNETKLNNIISKLTALDMAIEALIQTLTNSLGE